MFHAISVAKEVMINLTHEQDFSFSFIGFSRRWGGFSDP
jgi:hypothetical protein